MVVDFCFGDVVFVESFAFVVDDFFVDVIDVSFI